MYTVSERDMLSSLIVYLEAEGKAELASILHVSKFVYEPQYEFSYIIPNQKKLYSSLRVPLTCKAKVQEELEYLSKLACELYIDDDSYYFLGIKNVGMLPIQTEDIEFESKHLVLEKDSVFSNFIKFIIDNNDIDPLQKQYLFEACECGNKNNLLSATVMLGASAEMLLLDFCYAYCDYLVMKGNQDVYETFERKVIKARCAHDRLIEFLKRAKANATYFNQLGFEDIDLNFSFFDIIRQTRNDSGHPTGNTITLEQFKMILSNYQHFLPKTIAAIKTIHSQII